MGISSDIGKAMILAAGKGTRLRPLTLETPKVLLPIGGVPLIEHTLNWLKRHGNSEVAMNLHHLGEKIKDYLDDCAHFGVEIAYSVEDTLLGTAGGVKRMERFFDGTFVVVYGDVLTNFDLSEMIWYHQEKKAVATLAILEVPNPWDVGVVEMNREGKILSFVEKPAPGSNEGNLGSGGVYVLEKAIFDYIPDKCPSDFAYDVFTKLTELRLPVYGYVLKSEDYLIDIGTIERYRKANDDFKAGRIKIRYGKQSSISR